VREAVGYAQLSRPQVPLWTGLGEPGLRPLAAFGLVALLGALVTVALARQSEGVPEVNGALRPGD